MGGSLQDQAAPGPLTASAVMRFIDELEERSESWYRSAATAFPAHRAMLERCAAICAKNRVQVLRTYQETITDALEANYAFEGLDLSPYAEVPADIPDDLNQARALSLALEERVVACYEDVAGRSARLLATIPRVLQRAAEGRRRNAAFLRQLGGE